MPYKYPLRKFLSAEFADPEVPFGCLPPYRDTVHAPNTCLVCATGLMQVEAGIWRLRQKINIATLIPDAVSDRKITEISSKGSSQWALGTITSFAESKLSILGDNTQIFKSSPLSHDPLPDYAKNLFSDLGISIDDYTTLDVNLSQQVNVWVGWAAIHDYDITMSYSYFTDVMPTPGGLEITVVNAETGTPLSGIAVRLMQSTRLIRSGTTSASGAILWSSVDEGDYTIKAIGVTPTIWSGGYSDLEDLIKVEPNFVNAYTVRLAPLPRVELPWYAWAGIGVAVVGGTAFYFRRPLAPAVTVIREKVPYAARRIAGGARRLVKGYGAEEEEE